MSFCGWSDAIINQPRRLTDTRFELLAGFSALEKQQKDILPAFGNFQGNAILKDHPAVIAFYIAFDPVQVYNSGIMNSYKRLCYQLIFIVAECFAGYDPGLILQVYLCVIPFCLQVKDVLRIDESKPFGCRD